MLGNSVRQNENRNFKGTNIDFSGPVQDKEVKCWLVISHATFIILLSPLSKVHPLSIGDGGPSLSS